MKDRLRRFGRLAVVDTTPLRQVPGYRWLFLGMFLAQAGRQLTVVAVPFQVYQLTGSTLAVGLLGLAQLVPLLAVALVGGALADAVNRRRLLILTQLVLAGTAAGLLWNSIADQPLIWPLFVLSAVNAGVSAIDSPTRASIVPGLVGRSLLPSAMALNQTLVNVARAVFPALGGLLIATVGLAFSYGIEVVAFIAAALVIRRIPDQPPVGGGRKFELSSITEGLRYLKGRRLLQATFLIDLNAMVFGMPTALFPAMGTTVFGGDAFTVGLLFAAPGAGALLAALTSGWVSVVRRQGYAVMVAVIIWGIAIAIFGLTEFLGLALALLAIAGAADVVSAIFRGTIVQLAAPDELRGRLSSIHMAVVAGGPRLGDLEAGVVAALTSIRFSVVSGGLACIGGALLLGRWAPQFVGYRYEPHSYDTPTPDWVPPEEA
ncbi:MAG TPA: MFS transporter [Acidimicrobiia bacterium]|nr:MFS transporter [Acidimicrobiia bacterium]